MTPWTSCADSGHAIPASSAGSSERSSSAPSDAAPESDGQAVGAAVATPTADQPKASPLTPDHNDGTVDG